MVDMELGKAIRILRTAKGLRLNDLAKDARVSMPFLSMVENGGRQPSIAVVRRIAAGLGIPPEALILMAASWSEALHSSDARVSRLTESLRRLSLAEEALRRSMEAEPPANETE